MVTEAPHQETLPVLTAITTPVVASICLIPVVCSGHADVRAFGRGATGSMGLPEQPTVAEIAYGISRLRASRRRRALEESLADLLAVVQRARWTDEVSMQFGAIKAALERRGTRLEDMDIAIAAHALALGGALVTDDNRHMSRIPSLVIEDWSQAT